VLSHGERAPRARLRPLEPYRFAGEWPTQGELVAGAIRDFNVFTRVGRLRADVEPVRLGRRTLRELLESRHAFVHVLAGAARARITGEEEPFSLAAAESLRIDEARAGDELELVGAAPDAVVLVVRFRSHSPKA
jgi:environmental stress-induced protein Ves